MFYMYVYYSHSYSFNQYGGATPMKIKENEYRISKTAWLQAKETPEVEKQIANLTHISSGKIEPFQVVYYPPSGHYFVHHDCDNPSPQPLHPNREFARMLTLLIYLTDVNEDTGGQTNFPLSDTNHDDIDKKFNHLLETGYHKHQPQGGDQKKRKSKGFQLYGRNTPIFQTIPTSIMPQADMSTCKRGVNTTNLAAGDAVLFYNILPQANMDARLDPYALHAGCSVTQPKWLINSWRWNQPALNAQKKREAAAYHDEL
jgi:hypothetical protein